MINKAGELVDHVREAVTQHGATPHTEVRVRIGSMGPVYRIQQMKGVSDGRGLHLLLELCVVPESLG